METQLKGRMASKEEMKRKLEEMRMKYDKMQRKLLKSERRKSARNHVRKVLAEQANATSPHFSCGNLPSTCESITSVAGEVIHDSVEGEEPTSKSGSGREGRKQTLQRSISFKLEECVRENKIEKKDCERETYGGKRRGKERPKKFGINLATCLQRENLVNCGNCGRDDLDEKMEMYKESRLSDCKTSKSTKSGDKHPNFADTDEEYKTYMDQASVECEPSVKQGMPDVESHAFVKIHQRKLSEGDTQSASHDVDNRVKLRWRGVLMKKDLNIAVAWTGVCLHQLGSSLLLVLYHSHLAVLWVHTDHWEARQQWQTEEGKKITSVVLGGEAAQQITVLVMMKDGQSNTLSLLKCNLESGIEEAEDINLPDCLREAEELKTVLHRGDGGVVMQKTSTFLSDFFFFQCVQPSQMWQLDGLKRMSAVTFIPVMGAPNLFLSLSSNTLSLWMPASRIPLIDVVLDKLANVEVDEILWADSAGGLLFFIGLKHPSILSLYALNPATTMVLKIHKFLQPCAYDTQRVIDTSINGRFLVAMYSSRKLLIWDIYSGRALAEMSPPNDEIHQLAGVSNFLVLNGKDANLFEFTSLH